MRPIDADALMKAMYRRAFETDGDTMWQSGCWVRYRAIEQVVKDAPTIDAVEVVRCEDCKHHGMSECPMWEGMITDDWMWCCKGERKEQTE